ncbi:DUF2306 domain-containing protein [Actinokineospora auranticolor]|uniref:Putative membrane protein DUF2306 n=1 Tax=Actinokineospora auranticolor TaxID=155976 RepID=A0A2S6H0A1_9PSEU|nr:DUF2306 domain-containing protein [Actinokineospora auranticolor]PPK70903.1 putative membrane protein DUF2306 [Actinokineospora auranticolor]
MPQTLSQATKRAPWVVPVAAAIIAFLVYALPPYLGLRPDMSRVPATTSWHYPALVAHIGFGLIAMITGFLQCWPWFRNRHLALHRKLGRVYVFGGVLPAATAGLLVGITSPFGPVARFSHVVLVTLWFTSTVIGYRKARQRDFRAHREWMIRSFALTFSTITNRIWSPLLVLLFEPQLDTTFGGSELAMFQAIGGLSSWLGWTVPLLVVEWVLLRKKRRAPRGAPVESAA